MTSTITKNSNKNTEYKIPNKLANTSRDATTPYLQSQKTQMFNNPTLKQTTQIQNNSPCKRCHLGSHE